jgi:hypothetical protein
MVKSVRIIATSALFLLLGWVVPAKSLQEQQDHSKEQEKQQEQAKPAEKEPPKAEKQDKPQAKKQQDQEHQHQQQQAKAKQNEQQKQQDNSKKEQQIAQDQQDQQQAHRNNSAKQEQQQIKGQQQQQKQAGYSQPPQRTQAAKDRQRAQPEIRLSTRTSERIPDAHFRSDFGREHRFRIGSPVLVGGYSRFQYGGYWFGFVERWPLGWYYTDDVYIDYVDGGYYMYNPYYPGARFAISVVI